MQHISEMTYVRVNYTDTAGISIYTAANIDIVHRHRYYK